MAAIHNTAAAAGKGKFYAKPGGERFLASDFFPSLQADEPEETEEQMAENFLRMFGHPDFQKE